MRVLNKKQIRELTNLLDKQFGFNNELDYVFIKDNKDYYITNRDLGKIELNKLNVKRIGIFFGKLIDNNFILSIEGSQIIGNKSNKNIIGLDDEEIKSWFKGMNLRKSLDNGVYLLRYKNDFVGTCKVVNNELINSLDKSRRVFKLKI